MYNTVHRTITFLMKMFQEEVEESSSNLRLTDLKAEGHSKNILLVSTLIETIHQV